MLSSLLLKEWIKLRFFIGFVLVLILALLAHFYKELAFQFATIEPENMMWYRLTFLDYKPYRYFRWFLYVFAVTLAFVQFLPERSKNRVRIMAHLPLPLLTILGLHTAVGLSIILLVFGLMSTAVFDILSCYYPPPIMTIFVKDVLAYLLGMTIIFLGCSSAILEKQLSVAFTKLTLMLLAISVYETLDVNAYLLLWLYMPITLFIFFYDSFLSTKEQRLEKCVITVISVISLLFIVPAGMRFLFTDLRHHVHGYYLFYSPIQKQFVYQKNFGEHQFEYGIIDGQTFDRKTYESYLPFVYWADLDVQKKLPIDIERQLFDKQTIKDARLSLSYKRSYLDRNNKVLYPLINSIKDQGVIIFPDNMLHIDDKGFTIYHSDTNVDNKLTAEANIQAKQAKLAFPIQSIWGKFTNMKSYDLGYFIKDKHGDIFNFRRGDNKITVRKIDSPKDLVFISINENKQKKIAGFAIDKSSQLYLISWDGFAFIPINLSHFDYQSMDLQILSNPKYYQFRYDNEDDYYISVFDKQFSFVDEAHIK